MKRLKSMMVISALGGVLLQGADYKLPAGRHQLELKGNIMTNTGKRTATVTCPEPMTENSRTIIHVRLPQKGSVTLLTSRGKEQLVITNQGDSLNWAHTSADGMNSQWRPYPGLTGNQAYPYWWESTAYFPNGRNHYNFSLPHNLLNWDAYFRSVNNRKPDESWFPVAVEVANGRVRWYLDHILLQDQEATPEIHERYLQIRLSGGVELRRPVREKFEPWPDHFYPVNLANRFNAKGSREIAKQGKFEFGGIPFMGDPEDNHDKNCVDLGTSWFREGNLTSYEEPNQGSFGGRWGGALSGNPTRIQFRIPNRRYNAVYLLASCDERPDRVNRLTAQFYRPGSGFPQSFVPAEAIKNDGKLQLIRIPVRPEQLLEYADREVIELELTGDVHVYRAYPDPAHYSIHGGGIPSGVKVYAMTLEEALLKVDLNPESFANVWVGGAPAYKLTLENNSTRDMTVHLKLSAASYDATEKSAQEQTLAVPARKQAAIRFDLPLQKFGWHQVRLDVNGEIYERSLVILRPREYKARNFDARGFMFGIWRPNTIHYAPPMYDALRLAGPLGIDSISHDAWSLESEELRLLLRRYGIKNYMAARVGAGNREVDRPDIEQRLRENTCAPSEVNEPVFQYLFAEPGGTGTNGIFPEFYGEPRYVRTDAEQRKHDDYKRIIKNYTSAFRKVFPDKKVLMPWGDPCFAIPYLEDPETRELFDGIAYDAGYFDRLPEQQMHQTSLHRMYQFNHYWYKYRKEKPVLVTCEGPCLGGIKPGALTAEQHAAHFPRCILILAAYGIDRFFASIAGNSENASYWGEQHYGGGAFKRIKLDPHPVYATQGTLIRHLRHMEFVKWVPTGSLSTYCLQFKDARDGKLLHVLWTIRGRRPVDMKHSQVYDSMDNLMEKPVICQLPIYVYGNDGTLELGEPDHGDAELHENFRRLGNASDLFTIQRQDGDDEYIHSFARAVRRFPAAMKLDKTSGGLAVTLPPQEKDRGVMPYYTTLAPETPIVIPGKGKYLSMEVTAASDWGRIVYVLRDAKGEKWISTGTRDTWNNDDTPGASYFNFDGKRLVRFELPSHLPWDGFREMGTTWWGSAEGDGVVDLPLSLEKVFIERRSKAMYVNSLEPAPEKPVILGDIYVEYESPEMMKEQVALKMPPPPVTSAAFNPIKELENGSLPPSEIIKVEEPDHYYDGTRGIFHFREMPEAVAYDIYLSLSPDGANALKLGSRLKKSGQLVQGFLAHTDFYAFVVYCDQHGNYSKPSPPFKLHLQDNFGNK